MVSPYKIYYIANARMPTERAHGVQLAKMCEAFLEAGIDLELVVPKRKTDTRSVKEFYGLRVDIPLKRLRIPSLYMFARFGFFLGSLSFAVRYFFYLGWKRWVRGEKFIVYTTDLDQFSFFLIPLLGVPYFVEIHDAKRWSWQFTLLFKYTVGIITINKIIKKELIDVFSIAPGKIMVRSNGVDLAAFARVPSREEARAILALPDDKPIVVYVGKFYEWKGIDDVVQAAQLIGNDADIYIVGGDADELMRISGRKIVPSSLHCVGHRPFTEVPLWLAAADMLLLLGTKRNEYSYLHTSPMKSFEYMASRTLIIASATPANCEILGNGEALLYEPDNANDLAEKIRYALSHQDAIHTYADYALEKVKNLTWGMRGWDIAEFIKSTV